MTDKAKGLSSFKGFSLEPAPSLPPHERIAHLVNSDRCPQLIYLSLSYENMGFPIGVFSRAYEEFHYLDMIMCKAATAHMAKEFMERPSIEGYARNYSVLDEAERLQKEQYDLMQQATVNVGYDRYSAYDNEQVRDLAMGRGSSMFDEAARLNNSHTVKATERLQTEFERTEKLSREISGIGMAGSALDKALSLQADYEQTFGAGLSSSVVSEAFGKNEALNRNPFDTLIDREIERGELDFLKIDTDEPTLKAPFFDPPPPPKFETPKFDKTDEGKREDSKRHLELLAAEKQLYDLQLEAKKDQSEKLKKIADVQERMEVNSSKSSQKMFFLGGATLAASVFTPMIIESDLSLSEYVYQIIDFVTEPVKWIFELAKKIVVTFIG